MSKAIQLIKMIGSPFSEPIEPAMESIDLYNHAFKNRIGLLYLLCLKNNNILVTLNDEYKKLDFRARETIITVARAAKVLNDADIPYVVIKTLRPYPATPNDVDIVFMGERNDFSSVIICLKQAGYVVESNPPAPLQMLSIDPRGEEVGRWDKQGGIYYVDMYKEMSTDFYIYGDKQKFKNRIIHQIVLGLPVCVLNPQAELALILWHSVFPENSYALEVFYTTCFYLKTVTQQEILLFRDFVKENHFTRAVRASLTITGELHQKAFSSRPEVFDQLIFELGGMIKAEQARVEEKDFHFPYKYSVLTFVNSFLQKSTEKSALISIPVQAFHMMDPRFSWSVAKSLWQKFFRETYVQV